MGFLNKLFKSADSGSQVTKFDQLRWGTGMPMMLRLRSGIAQVTAFGTFSFSIADAQAFAAQKVDLKDEQKLKEFSSNLGRILASKCISVLGEMGPACASVEEMASRLPEIARRAQRQAAPEFQSIGLKLESVVVEGVRG